MANATGNEARVFGNVGNAGMTYWSPDINIFRDPRWGRGQETPGEDPFLTAVYAREFVGDLQGDQASGFLKVSACCKHFAAHSLEEDRFSFNSIVTDQDMADTYLPAFKSCVEGGGASCVMCAYNSINGVPACAHKPLLTDTVRGEWGFDGYVTSDCDAAAWVFLEHNYTQTGEEGCHAVLDAGMDIECPFFVKFFQTYLRSAVEQGVVPLQLVDRALARAFRVLMRLGYFEKQETRPFKELLPSMVDSQPHQALALEAARQSIVLLKNAPITFGRRTGHPALPIDAAQFRTRRVPMVAIGPLAIGEDVFLGNYHGIPSFIKEPYDEIKRYIPDLEYERGCDVMSFDDSSLEAAEDLARASEQVVLVVGITAHEIEDESRDRTNLTLPGLQNELIRRVLAVDLSPVIMFVVSGGAIALEEWKDDPRVGAIIWAGYLGQSTGEAMADVMFGIYNPSGRLAQTFYANDFINQVSEFGYGLSYTSFDYSLPGQNKHAEAIRLPATAQATADDCAIELELAVRNSGQVAGDHSALWFLAPPGAGKGGRPIKSLFNFDRVHNVQPQESRQVKICLNRDDFHFQLANEEGEFLVVTGEWKLTVGNLERTVLVF